MPIIEITSLEQPGVDVFSTLTEAQLRNRLEPEKGVFIAESPKVIRVALAAGYKPLALLCEGKHLTGDAADIAEQCHTLPIYTGGRELLTQLTGYTLTRGVLCAMRRPTPPSVEDICRNARRIAVFLIPWTWIDTDLSDLRNLGFRTAAMALTENAIPLDSLILKTEPKLALIMGTEGDGLPQTAIAGADYVVRIPMAHGVDSLNVAAASAVAFWELRSTH